MDLPNEVLEMIVKHSDFEARQRIRLLDHRFYGVVSNVAFTRKYTEGEAFSWENLTKKNNINFMELSLGRSQLQAFLEGSESEAFASATPKIAGLKMDLGDIRGTVRKIYAKKNLKKEILKKEPGISEDDLFKRSEINALGDALNEEFRFFCKILRKFSSLEVLNFRFPGTDSFLWKDFVDGFLDSPKDFFPLKKLFVYLPPDADKEYGKGPIKKTFPNLNLEIL
ncbi:MAG: hypothetical protein ACRC4G_00560 [Alphaproteobacteria bacterium]